MLNPHPQPLSQKERGAKNSGCYASVDEEVRLNCCDMRQLFAGLRHDFAVAKQLCCSPVLAGEGLRADTSHG